MVFACIKDREGLEAIVEHILKAREGAVVGGGEAVLTLFILGVSLSWFI